jgi:hypothetical protein
MVERDIADLASQLVAPTIDDQLESLEQTLYTMSSNHVRGLYHGRYSKPTSKSSHSQPIKLVITQRSPHSQQRKSARQQS